MVTKYALLKQSSSYYNKIQKIKNVLAKCPQHRKHPLLATSQLSTIFGTFSKSVVIAGAEGDEWWCWWCGLGWPPVGHFWNLRKILSSLKRGGWWFWWCGHGWPPVGHFWNYLKKCRHRWSGGWWCWWCGQGWPCPSPRRTRRTMASPPSSSVA